MNVYKVRENGTLDIGTIYMIEEMDPETGEIRLVPEPTLTQQQFRDECDVNKIMEKYVKTGSITHVRNAAEGVYQDLTLLPDYQTALQTVIDAGKAFEQVPAPIRMRFNNDPHEFIKFLSDKSNDEESYKLGLKVRPIPPPLDPQLQQLQQINETLSKQSKKSKQQSLPLDD